MRDLFIQSDPRLRSGDGRGPVPLSSAERVDDETTTPGSHLNYRLLVISGVALVAAILGIGFVHDHQVERTAEAHRALYDASREEGDDVAALRHLRRYLALAPEDDELRDEEGMLVHSVANNPKQKLRAFRLLEQTLRENPERHDLRRAVVELLTEFGLEAEAVRHLEVLSQAMPDDRALAARLAAGLERIGRYADAADAYQRCVELAPLDYPSYEPLVNLWQWRLDRGDDADDLLNRLVQQNPLDHEPYLLRARHHVGLGNVDLAAADVRAAYRLAPEARDVLVAVGRMISSDGAAAVVTAGFDLRDIRRKIESLVDTNPNDPEVPAVLAELAIVSGDRDRAIELLQDALTAFPDNDALRWRFANVLVGTGRIDEARAEIAKLEESSTHPAYIDFLEASISRETGDYLEACRQFEKVRKAGDVDIDLRFQAHMMLAACYRACRLDIRELEVLRETVSLRPYSQEARLQLAQSLRRLGRYDEALNEYRQLLSFPGVPVAVARFLIDRNLQLPPSARQWTETERILNLVPQDDESLLDVVMTRAEILAVQGELGKTRELFDDALRREPGEVRLWVALAQLEVRSGNRERALEVLEEATRTLGPRLEISLERINFWSTSPDEDAVSHIREGEKLLEKYPADRDRIVAALVSAYARIGDAEGTQKWLSELARLRPYDFGVRRQLFQIALELDDMPAAEALIAEMRENEGDAGIYWRLAQAQLDIARADNGEVERLIRARRLVMEVREIQPNSPTAALLLARLDQLAGDRREAVDHLMEAVNFGARNISVVAELVAELTRYGRFSDAEEVLRQFEEQQQLPLVQAFGELALDISIRTKNYDRALRVARMAVDGNPDDTEKRLWLAQVQALDGQLQAAEATFRDALRRDPGNPGAWVGLIAFLSRQDRTDECAELLAEIPNNVATGLVPVTLAQSHEALGDTEAAERYYVQALELDPERTDIIWKNVEFFLRNGDLQRAEQLLTELLDPERGVPSTQLIQVRRRLAPLLVLRGTYPDFERAMELIDANLAESPDSREDLLVRARLLQSRSYRSARLEAIRILEQLDAQQPLSNGDLFTLARLYVANDQWANARYSLVALLARSNPDPRWLRFAIRQLIEHGELGGSCKTYLEQLEALAPDSYAAMELRFRRDIASGEVSVGVSRIEKWLNRDEKPAEDQVRAVAQLMGSQVELLRRRGEGGKAELLAQSAEALLRQLAKQNPQDKVLLARFLMQNGSTDEALRWCDEAAMQADPALVAQNWVDFLRSTRLDASQTKRVVAGLQELALKHPERDDLLLQLANARLLVADYARAENLYRDVISRHPGSVLALNDLALLIALRDRNPNEALELVNRALQTAGPLGYLLDTRAQVYIRLGKFDLAIRDLNRAIDEDPTADKYFHLAEAELARGALDAARRSFQEALQLKLHVRLLHPLEKPMYAKLTAALR